MKTLYVLCSEITCKPLATIPDGRVQPQSCVAEKSVFGSVCTYTCQAGYKLIGPYSRQCTVTGLWKPDDEAESKCIGKAAIVYNLIFSC